MDPDRFIRPTAPRTSRVWLVIFLAVGLLFVSLGFISSSDYRPSPIRDTILIAGGALLVLTAVVGLRSPTFSLSGRTPLSPSRLYAQLGVALLALGLGSTFLSGFHWGTIGWMLPAILALHRAWLLHRLARLTRDTGLNPPPTAYP